MPLQLSNRDYSMQLIYLFQRVAELIFAASYAQFYDYSCTGKTLKIGSLSMHEKAICRKESKNEPLFNNDENEI